MSKLLRVLMVEDSTSDELLILRQLKVQGYDVFCKRVDNATALSQALYEQPWDIVISDYVLPGFSGLGTLKIIQEKNLDLPCIITSGRIDDETAVAAMRAGAKDYIMKDNLKRLGPAIERELFEAETRRESLKAQEALQLNEIKLASIVESSNDAIISETLNGTITSWNQGAEKIFGYSRSEAIGQNITILTAPDLGNDIPMILYKIQNGEKVANYETIRVRQDGTRINVSLTASPLYNDSGEIIGASTISRDITEHKAMEGQILLSNKILNLFWEVSSKQDYLKKAANLIHDWCHCDCIGIRLVDDETGSVPYITSQGFSIDFLQLENILYLNSDSCACTRVVANQAEPQDQPAMTPSGTFFLTNTREFVKQLSPQQLLRFRGNCLKHGYQTIAVVPIRYRQTVLGAIHIADSSIAAFSLREVNTLESIASLLGQGIYRFDIEDKKRNSEARLAEAQKIAHLGNWEWDIRNNTLSWSDEVYRIFGLSPLEFEVSYPNFLARVDPADRESVQRAVNESLAEKKPYSIDHRILHVDGTDHVVHERAHTDFSDSGAPLRMIGTVQDITELKRKEEELRALSRRLVEVQESERRTIARELHDEIGQTLTALKMLLAQATRLPPKDNSAVMEEAKSVAGELMQKVRELSLSLRPSMLDDLGLLPTLVWHFERFSAQTGIQIKFEHDGLQSAGQSLSPEVNTAAYRVVQEALTNIARYAEVKEADVEIRLGNNKLFIRIQDHGRGFRLSDLNASTSTGISGMRERVHLLEGKLVLDSFPGQGTRILVELPVAS